MRCGERMRQCPVGSIVSRPNCAIHPATPAGNWEDRPDERRSHGPLAVEEEEMVEEKAWQVVTCSGNTRSAEGRHTHLITLLLARAGISSCLTV